MMRAATPGSVTIREGNGRGGDDGNSVNESCGGRWWRRQEDAVEELGRRSARREGEGQSKGSSEVRCNRGLGQSRLKEKSSSSYCRGGRRRAARKWWLMVDRSRGLGELERKRDGRPVRHGRA